MASARSRTERPDSRAMPYSVATLRICVRGTETVLPAAMAGTIFDSKVPSFFVCVEARQMKP